MDTSDDDDLPLPCACRRGARAPAHSVAKTVMAVRTLFIGGSPKESIRISATERQTLPPGIVVLKRPR